MFERSVIQNFVEQELDRLEREFDALQKDAAFCRGLENWKAKQKELQVRLDDLRKAKGRVENIGVVASAALCGVVMWCLIRSFPAEVLKLQVQIANGNFTVFLGTAAGVLCFIVAPIAFLALKATRLLARGYLKKYRAKYEAAKEAADQEFPKLCRVPDRAGDTTLVN